MKSQNVVLIESAQFKILDTNCISAYLRADWTKYSDSQNIRSLQMFTD